MKKSKYRFNIKKEWAIIACVAAVTLIFMLHFFELRAGIKAKRRELEDLQIRCAEQQAENEELQKALEEVGDEYIIKIAREQYDYVFPGERVYIIRSGN